VEESKKEATSSTERKSSLKNKSDEHLANVSFEMPVKPKKQKP